MKKFLFPILYSLLLIPTFFCTIFLIILSENVGRDFSFGPSDDRYTFVLPGSGEFEALLAIIILRGMIFWVGNRILNKIENLRTPYVIDHIRQSLGFYFLLIICLFVWLKTPTEDHGGLGYAYFLGVSLISVWAVVINAVYLFRLRKFSSKSL